MSCLVSALSAVFCSGLVTCSADNSMFIIVTHCTTTSKESTCRIICMLCQRTSPKRWFAKVSVTSYSDVTNSGYLVTMKTIGHWSILEFGRRAYNQAVAPGITRPLHASGWEPDKRCLGAAHGSLDRGWEPLIYFFSNIVAGLLPTRLQSAFYGVGIFSQH